MCVHKLSGAAGVFNLQTVSCAATAVEEAIVERHAGRGTLGTIEAGLKVLLDCMDRAATRSAAVVNPVTSPTSDYAGPLTSHAGGDRV
jgi:HPt (histidine-containing phosphotransfer) domain-containing protein